MLKECNRMNIKKLDELSPDEGGNKARMLARLRQLGFNVPQSYVLLNIKKPFTQQEISDVYQALHSPLVIARMSTTIEDSTDKSYAGIFDSVLNISSSTQLFHTLLLLQEKDYSKLPSAYAHPLLTSAFSYSCLIQPMITPAYSGVLFTADPASGRRDLAMVSLVSGHNQSLTAGCVDGHHLVWHKHQTLFLNDDFPHAFIHIKNKLIHLIKESIRLSYLLHTELDIEWAIDRKGDLYWLQARAITTLPHSINELDSFFDPNHAYTFINLSEVFSKPLSPLTQSLVLGAMNNISQKINLTHWKDPAEKHLNVNQTIFKITHGHACLDVSYLIERSLYFLGFKPSKLSALFGTSMEKINPNDFKKQPFYKKLIHTAITLTCLARMKSLFIKAHKELNRITPIQMTKTNDFIKISQVKLDLLQLSVTTHSLSCLNASIFMDITEKRLKKEKSDHVSNCFSSLNYRNYSKDDDSISMYHDLIELKNNIEEHADSADHFYEQDPENAFTWLKYHVNSHALNQCFTHFIATHGHRGFNELSLHTPSWSEDPYPLIQMLQIKTNSTEIDTESDFSHSKASQPLTGSLKRNLTYLARSLAFREQTKSLYVKSCRVIREHYLQVAELLMAEGHWQDKNLIFFLTKEEIEKQIIKPDIHWSILAQKRRDAYAYQEGLSFPLDTIGQPMPFVFAQTTDQNALVGRSIGIGTVRGKALVVRDVLSIKSIEPNRILIANSLDVCHIPILIHFLGVVAENGSSLSHIAILLRESRIPSILSVPQATLKIKNGDEIELDCSSGLVKIIQQKAP